MSRTRPVPSSTNEIAPTWMPIILLEETAACPRDGIARAALAPAVIFRNSRRFTSEFNMDFLLLSLVAADVHFPGSDSWCTIKIQFSHRDFLSCAGMERGRIWLQMKIVRGSVHKTRVQEMRVPVIPRGLDIFVEAGH